MINNYYYMTLVIVAMFIATFLTRSLPFLLLRGKEENALIKYLSKYLPPAIMMLLVIYCLKDFNLRETPFEIPRIIAIIIVILVHFFKRNILLSIASGTAIYIFTLKLLLSI